VDAKLERIRKLINDKERVDSELEKLISGADAPRRGRPPKEVNDSGSGSERPAEETERQEAARS
jgi:hypothetical protein